jgi:hypothetical protein
VLLRRADRAPHILDLDHLSFGHRRTSFLSAP